MQKKHDKKIKVALITGAARRIGAAIAENLHAAGINVVVHCHTSQKEAKKLCAFLNKQRENSAAVLKADLSILTNLSVLVQRAVEIWGGLDILVNNASVFPQTAIGKVSSAQWDAILDTNLKAPFFLAQAAFPYLKKRQGSIVNIVDIHGNRPMRDYPVYCISKAGLQMLTKALARELAPAVRVNSVSPGEILWPEGENSLSIEIKQKILDRIALKRHGEPTEIAKAVLFLVRDGDYITGHDLVVDGGRLLFG
ncbi:MAG: fabG 3 [Gammaproteobacteria bacterium]|jgi:pteridine reductase|nr:fabG 3 [Gammaproteobacteria bacterium]